MDGSRHDSQARGTQQKYGSTDPVQDQVMYLQTLASVEIPKAEMGQEELEEKENLRLALEQICRDAVAQYEREKDENFDANMVELKCFGSLSSGFATHSSDMDLAILSPNSTPALSSVESEIPRLLEKTLLDLGYGARLLTRTRVPIIKFCEKPTSELAQALLQEREKWEKERDSPTKPKAEKIGDQEVDKESKDGSKNVLDAASTRANDNTKNSGGTVQASIPNSKHEAENKTAKSNNTGGNLDSSQKSDEANSSDDTPRSDDELVYLYKLAMDEGWYDAEERKIIKSFLLAVGKQGPGSDDASLQTARLELKSLTNILHKYRPPKPENHLDFPKTGVGIQCDINFSNPLALHNTLLLKCYSLCDPRVRPMILFVKAWAKRRKINSPYHGTLSSYGYVLMVLHYLVNIVNPSIAPNLQTTRKAAQDKSPGNNAIIDGYGVRFWRSENEIKDLARLGMLTRNSTDSVGSLLRGFFHYYAQQGFYSPSGGFCWAKDVLSLRTERGILTKQEKDWTGARTVVIEPTIPGGASREIRHRYLLAIEDPFEIDHNIARTVVHNGIVAIRDEFRRAHHIIQGGTRPGLQDLFAEAENREHLGWRAFGPLPRKDEGPIQGKDQTAAGPSSGNGKPVPGVKERLPTGSSLKKGEPACSGAEKKTVRFSSEADPVRSNKDQPAKKELNGNQGSSHVNNSLVKDTQVPSVVNDSSSSTASNRDSAKIHAKGSDNRDEENPKRQEKSKPRRSRKQRRPAKNQSEIETKEDIPPANPNNSTLTSGIEVSASSPRELPSSGSGPHLATQANTYIHNGLVCNVEASPTLIRDSAPTIQGSWVSVKQEDVRVPEESTENGSTRAEDAESPDSGAGWATAESSSPEALNVHEPKPVSAASIEESSSVSVADEGFTTADPVAQA